MTTMTQWETDYMATCQKFRLLLGVDHLVGDRELQSDSFYRFIAGGDQVASSIVTWCTSEWTRGVAAIAINEESAAQLKEKALAEYEVFETELLEVLDRSESDLAEIPSTVWNKGFVKVLVISGLLFSALRHFVSTVEDNRDQLAHVCTLPQKRLAFEGAISYYAYQFWATLDSVLIDPASNRKHGTPEGLMAYSQSIKALLSPHLSDRLAVLQNLFWRSTPTFAEHPTASIDFRFLDNAQ